MLVTAPAVLREMISNVTTSGRRNAVATSAWVALAFQFTKRGLCLISRLPGSGTDWVALLKDPNTYFYVCGLKSMEEGVVLALHDVATQAGLDWETLGFALKKEGRLHLETY